jgi:hypothetical protein
VSFPPAGGPLTLSVTTGAGCAWRAVSTSSWFAIVVSPAATAGSGTVQIVTGPNTTSATRTGTVTIGQQTVQVSQAASPSFSLTGRIKEAWVDIGLSGVQVAVPGAAPAVTDHDGNYTIAGLLPGPYVVTLSRPSFHAKTQTVVVSGDTTLSTTLLSETVFPLSADDIAGIWAGGGPYPDEPFRLTLIHEGNGLAGWYIDRRYASDSVTGTYVGRALAFRVPVADGVLTFECTVDDERHVHGLVKNERLGGNFPISMTR